MTSEHHMLLDPSHQRDLQDKTSAGLSERGVVALVYLAGVAAGVALGRFVPLKPGIDGNFGISLAAYGWLVSGVTVVAACLALPAGLWIARRDLGRVLSAGLGVMLLGGLLEVMASTVYVLYGARALEGVGYLAVVVTGPVLLTARCRPVMERRALALWSTFVPVGMAVASAMGMLEGTIGWRAAAALTLVPAGVGVAGSVRWLSGIRGRPSERHASYRGGLVPVFQLSLAFSLIALIGVTTVTLLPSLGTDREVRSAVGNATATVVATVSVPGGLLSGLLLGRGIRSRVLAVVPLLGMLCAAAVMYQLGAWVAVAIGAAVLQFAGGMVLAVLYGSVPSIARTPTELGRAYGLLNQAGSVGTLLGPPVFGFAVTHAGWSAGTVLTAAAALIGSALFLSATSKRPGPSVP